MDYFKDTPMIRKKIVNRRDIPCSVCERRMHVVFYQNKKYRGGHYFGKVPLYRKSELRKMERSGTRRSKLNPNWAVYNYNPKPYAHFEYWECPECYWHPMGMSRKNSH
jgi:hypothetical protein